MQASALLLCWGSYHWAHNLLVLIIYFSSLLCCPLCFQGSPQTRQRECFLVFGNFSVFKTPFPGRNSLPRTELPPYLLCLFFCLLYFFLPVFEDNDLVFWVPDVLCQNSEVVLWSLLSIEMFFWGIFEGESSLPVLFLCHLRTIPPFPFLDIVVTLVSIHILDFF